MTIGGTEADLIRDWVATFTPTKAKDAARSLGWSAVKVLENRRRNAFFTEFSEIWNGHRWNYCPWSRT